MDGQSEASLLQEGERSCRTIGEQSARLAREKCAGSGRPPQSVADRAPERSSGDAFHDDRPLAVLEGGDVGLDEVDSTGTALSSGGLVFRRFDDRGEGLFFERDITQAAERTDLRDRPISTDA